MSAPRREVDTRSARSRLRPLPVSGAVFSLLLMALPACRLGDPGADGDHLPAGRNPGSSPVASESAPEGTRVYRGHASYGHEVRSMRPCGAEEALWAVDVSGLLWDLHAELAPGLEPYEEVFAVVRGVQGPPPPDGFGADYPGEIRIDELLYVAWEGFGCSFDWSRFAYRAQGNEPFWWAEVAPGGRIRMGRMGEEERSRQLVRESRSPTELRFVGEGDPREPAELTLSREPCRDTMSEAYYGLSATLRLGNEKLRGCALPGTVGESASN